MKNRIKALLLFALGVAVGVVAHITYEDAQMYDDLDDFDDLEDDFEMEDEDVAKDYDKED